MKVGQLDIRAARNGFFVAAESDLVAESHVFESADALAEFVRGWGKAREAERPEPEPKTTYSESMALVAAYREAESRRPKPSHEECLRYALQAVRPANDAPAFAGTPPATPNLVRPGDRFITKEGHEVTLAFTVGHTAWVKTGSNGERCEHAHWVQGRFPDVEAGDLHYFTPFPVDDLLVAPTP